VSSVKNHQFLPVYFAPPLKGFPLELGIGGGVKKLEWWATGPRKKFRRCVQPSGYNAPRQTLGDSKNCACA